MSTEELPALLWSGNWPGDDYNSEDELYGLFRSYYLVRVSRATFFIMSSSTDQF
jgi:hypothetical protein